MVNKKVSTRLIWSKAIVSAWPCSMRIHDCLGHGRVHIGLLRMEIKHVNRKTSVYQISKASPMKWRWVSCASEHECKHVWLCHMWSHQWGDVVVDQQCRESNGKVKIEGYTRVSDEQAHHHDLLFITTMLFSNGTFFTYIHIVMVSCPAPLCSKNLTQSYNHR